MGKKLWRLAERKQEMKCSAQRAGEGFQAEPVGSAVVSSSSGSGEGMDMLGWSWDGVGQKHEGRQERELRVLMRRCLQ